MASKISTYKNLADFERVGTQIAKQMGHFETLMQEASVAALEHLEQHGNYNILKPLWQAAQSWRSASMANKWKAWLIGHSWLVYNPKNLRGAQLRDAAYETLWAKDKAKKIDLDGARKTPWFEQSITRAPSTKPVNLETQVARFMKSLQALLEAKKIVAGKGKEQHTATIGEIRAEIRSQLEALATPVIVKGAPNKNDRPKATTAKPVKGKTAKPVKGNMKGQPRVAKADTANTRKAA